MAKKKNKDIRKKILAWIMLLVMLGSALTLALSVLFG